MDSISNCDRSFFNNHSILSGALSTLKLLRLIDQKQTFSEEAVFTLKRIKQCALTITGIYILTMPFIYLFAEKDDAPGAIIIGMVPLFVSFVVAVFASLLQKLFKNALEIKTENDLTV